MTQAIRGVLPLSAVAGAVVVAVRLTGRRDPVTGPPYVKPVRASRGREGSVVGELGLAVDVARRRGRMSEYPKR